MGYTPLIAHPSPPHSPSPHTPSLLDNASPNIYPIRNHSAYVVGLMVVITPNDQHVAALFRYRRRPHRSNGRDPPRHAHD